MIRRAILIGHNEASFPILNGVNKDLHDVGSFLLSDFGGAWNRNEIAYLPNPSVQQLDNALKRIRCDYLVIMFAGHGAYIPQYGSYICLNETNNYFISNLLGRAPRQLVIVDACRTKIHLSPWMRLASDQGVEVGAAPNLQYRAFCRQTYEQFIARAEKGTVLVQSCSVGESAGDTVQGGLFTQSLMDYVWRAAQQASDGRNTRLVIPVDAALTHAAQRTYELAIQQSQSSQSPCITPLLNDGKQRQMFFPIAVA